MKKDINLKKIIAWMLFTAMLCYGVSICGPKKTGLMLALSEECPASMDISELADMSNETDMIASDAGAAVIDQASVSDMDNAQEEDPDGWEVPQDQEPLHGTDTVDAEEGGSDPTLEHSEINGDQYAGEQISDADAIETDVWDPSESDELDNCEENWEKKDELTVETDDTEAKEESKAVEDDEPANTVEPETSEDETDHESENEIIDNEVQVAEDDFSRGYVYVATGTIVYASRSMYESLGHVTERSIIVALDRSKHLDSDIIYIVFDAGIDEPNQISGYVYADALQNIDEEELETALETITFSPVIFEGFRITKISFLPSEDGNAFAGENVEANSGENDDEIGFGNDENEEPEERDSNEIENEAADDGDYGNEVDDDDLTEADSEAGDAEPGEDSNFEEASSEYMEGENNGEESIGEEEETLDGLTGDTIGNGGIDEDAEGTADDEQEHNQKTDEDNETDDTLTGNDDGSDSTDDLETEGYSDDEGEPGQEGGPAFEGETGYGTEVNENEGTDGTGDNEAGLENEQENKNGVEESDDQPELISADTNDDTQANEETGPENEDMGKATDDCNDKGIGIEEESTLANQGLAKNGRTASVEYTFTYNSVQYTLKENTISVDGYIGTESVVTIPMMINNVRVTAIGANAFLNNDKLVTIIVPQYIEIIGESAFKNCSKLREMRPESTEEITVDITGYDPESPQAQTVTTNPGNEYTINIYLHGYDITNASLAFDFDTDKFQFVSGQTEYGTADMNGVILSCENGELMGPVAVLTLKVSANIDLGDYEITVSVTEAKDKNGNTVSCFAYSDHIVVEAGSASKVPGDLNDDGKVNLKDSMLLLQYLAGWEVDFNEINADVNSDGKVNLKDSMLLLQYLAGWESEYIFD